MLTTEHKMLRISKWEENKTSALREFKTEVGEETLNKRQALVISQNKNVISLLN